MNKIILVTTITLLASCASMEPSNEELATAPKCTVWKDGLLGSKNTIEVEGDVAKQKRACWIMNMFLCSYTDYKFKDNGIEIKSSLPPEDKTIATLNGTKMTVAMTGITVDPFELKKGYADVVYQGIIGPKQNAKIQFSPSCSMKQAALGLLTVVAK